MDPVGLAPGAYHLAATMATQRAPVTAVHHYSPEAIGAMTIVGILAIIFLAFCVLGALALLRYITGGKRRAKVDSNGKY